MHARLPRLLIAPLLGVGLLAAVPATAALTAGPAGAGPATAPAEGAAPTLTSAGNGSLDVAWVAPDDGGSPITNHTVEVAVDPAGSWSHGAGCAVVAAPTTRCTVGGLTNGTSYLVRIDGFNVFGITASQIGGPFTPVVPLPPANRDGYWLVGADGGVFSVGGAGFYGSMGGQSLNAPVVGIAAGPVAATDTSIESAGYWQVARDGGVLAFGSAGFDGSIGGRTLNTPIVGIAATPDRRDYCLVGADGGVLSFGDARFDGSLAGEQLTSPVVAIAGSLGMGYFLVLADGTTTAYGAASGTSGPQTGTSVGIASSAAGGAWVVTDAGAVRTVGAATDHGQVTGPLAAPVSGISTTGDDYLLTARDGGVFACGSAVFSGSMGGKSLNAPVIGIVSATAEVN